MNDETDVQGERPLWKVVCARIADHFNASGETQKEFAAHVGVDRTTLSHWLAGRAAPRIDNIDNIAMHLGIPRRCLHCDEHDEVCPTCTPKRRPPRT